MLKKLTLLAMSVGALLAFAAPAAQASGALITNVDNGVPTNVVGTSTNTISHTSIGTLECTTVELSVHIKENANTTAKGSGTGVAKGTPKASEPDKHSGHCGSSSGAVVEVTTVTVTDIHLTKHGEATTGTGAFSFTYDLRNKTGEPLIAACEFSSAAGGVTVTKTSTDTLNVNGNLVRTKGPVFCPATGTITGDFTLEEAGTGKHIIIH